VSKSHGGRSHPRRLRSVWWLAAIAVSLSMTSLPANAQSTSTNATTNNSASTTIPVEDLGAQPTIRVPADGFAQRISVKVPDGLLPVAFRSDWQRTPEVTAGALTVEQDGKSIASADVAGVPLIAENTSI
jgi:hypothetical protein